MCSRCQQNTRTISDDCVTTKSRNRKIASVIAFFRGQCTIQSACFHSEEPRMSVTAAPLHTFTTTDGRNISTFPMVSECTVAQAARFLDVSEGYVNEMLNAGRVIFRLEDGERLIEWDNLPLPSIRKRNTSLHSICEIFRKRHCYLTVSMPYRRMSLPCC